MKVLVVDDSKTMRMIVKRALRQADLPALTFVEAENGEVAYDLLARGGGFDLVLCDWNMPQMTGIELLRRLDAAGVDVDFGFITSESSADVRSEARAAGAMFVLSKPFTAAMLEDELVRNA